MWCFVTAAGIDSKYFLRLRTRHQNGRIRPNARLKRPPRPFRGVCRCLCGQGYLVLNIKFIKHALEFATEEKEEQGGNETPSG